jgi:acyl-CoA thioesterase-2
MCHHQPSRADEWVLYDQDSPHTGGGLGLAPREIYTRDGRLVVTVMQEGLIRLP